MSGQFKPGQSGNPGGRPKVHTDGARRMARLIQEESRGGAELVEHAFAIYRHPVGAVDVVVDARSGGALHGLQEITADMKRWAHEWLTERGFGKALQSIDLTGEIQGMPAVDLAGLAGLSEEQLEAADQVLREVEKAAGG